MSSCSSSYIVLDADLSPMAAAPLAQSLTSVLNTPVELNAENVVNVDKSCLQILIAAARHWNYIGVPFEIKNTTQEFLSAVQALCLDPVIFKPRVH